MNRRDVPLFKSTMNSLSVRRSLLVALLLLITFFAWSTAFAEDHPRGRNEVERRQQDRGRSAAEAESSAKNTRSEATAERRQAIKNTRSETVSDAQRTQAKQRNKPPTALAEAEGRPHTIVEKAGKNGQYTTHNGDGTWKQYRGSGKDHGGIPRPNVKEAGKNVTPDGREVIDKGRVRPAHPNEIPGG